MFVTISYTGPAKQYEIYSLLVVLAYENPPGFWTPRILLCGFGARRSKLSSKTLWLASQFSLVRRNSQCSRSVEVDVRPRWKRLYRQLWSKSSSIVIFHPHLIGISVWCDTFVRMVLGRVSSLPPIIDTDKPCLLAQRCMDRSWTGFEVERWVVAEVELQF